MTVALIALFVALGGTGYAALKLPKNSVGTAQLKNNAVQSAKVKNNSLTGADVNEATLATVPTAGNANQLGGLDPNAYLRAGTKVGDSAHADTADHATSAVDAGALAGKGPSDFVGTGQSAGGDISGTFGSLQIGADSVGAPQVADNSLSQADISDFWRNKNAAADDGADALPSHVFLEEPGPSTFDVEGTCLKSGANLTASVTITNTGTTYSMDSNAPNGDVGQADIASNVTKKLIQVGPSASPAFSTGDFAAAEVVPVTFNLQGLITVKITPSTTRCDFLYTRFGTG